MRFPRAWPKPTDGSPRPGAPRRWPPGGIRGAIRRMKTSRFFRTVWRVNGVLVLLAFVLAGGAALIGLVFAAADALGDDTPDAPAAIVEGDEHLAYGLVEEIEGTSHVLLPLTARAPSMPYSSDGAGVTRNLLFYDAATGATRWLRPDHRGAVLDHTLLRDAGKEEGPVRWIRFELADADTDGDGEVTGEDAARVAVSGPGGEGLATVVGDADEILGYAPPRDGTLLVFFRRGAEHLVAEVDLAAREVRRTTALPGR